MFRKISDHIIKRKFTYGFAAMVLLTGGYFGVKSLENGTAATHYVLAAAQKGTLITSVSGSGQISASDQIDIKPKVSGDVLNVAVKNGQEVKAGDVIARIDATDTYKAVRDAQVNVESAQLSLDKLKQPSSDSILQAENSLTAAQNSLAKLKLSQQTSYQNALDAKQKAEDNISKGYEDAYNTITSIFLDLPNAMSGLDNVLHGYEISDHEPSVGGRQDNTSALASSTYPDSQTRLSLFKNSAENDYATASAKYDTASADYKSTSGYSDEAAIDSLLDETVDMVKAVAQATKSENTYLGTWVDLRTEQKWSIFPEVTDYQKDLSTYLGTVNSDLSKVLSSQSSVQDNADAFENAETDISTMDQNNPIDLAAAEASIQEKQNSLDSLKAGPDALDLRSSELSLQQKVNALNDARAKLVDYTVRAPFDGVIVAVNAKKGDAASSGTAIVTLITKQSIAEVSLNEVDAAKVKVGQKATLTFDAVSDLSITGEVADMDSLGTVSQGVVTYNVKISFDTQDDRIKSGMSTSVSIITDAKSDVLVVPNAAVKSSAAGSYVELPDETVDETAAASSSGVVLKNPLRQQLVQVGDANDSQTEITSGLNEGDLVVVRTITPTTTSATSSSSQNRSILGGSTGGAVRINTGGGGFGGGVPRGD